MPIQFTCPHCGVTTEVADQFAGLRGPCASCLNTIEIPQLSAELAAEPAEPVAPERSSRLGTWYLLAIVGAIAALIVGSAVLVGQFVPSWFQRQLTQQEVACRDRLEQIGQALRAYHAEYDQFPPAVVFAPDGRPMHSWRVLILPYLEEQALYKQYHLDEPWDGPRNKLLTAKMPVAYGCPSDPASYRGQTSYVAVVGADTAWPQDGVMRLRNRPAAIGGKLLVVEVESSGIFWLQPADFRRELLSKRINDPQGAGIRSLHLDGANAVLVDGSIKHLPTTLSEQELAELLSVPPPPETNSQPAPAAP
ncbi:MAG: DUF1559 domain-containing protein [Pirellulales bacterium]|nr:DUF1559 domain-containing protein [Pirellulales bacterium]